MIFSKVLKTFSTVQVSKMYTNTCSYCLNVEGCEYIFLALQPLLETVLLNCNMYLLPSLGTTDAAVWGASWICVAAHLCRSVFAQPTTSAVTAVSALKKHNYEYNWDNNVNLNSCLCNNAIFKISSLPFLLNSSQQRDSFQHQLFRTSSKKLCHS